MTARTQPLRSTAGRNSRKRPPLNPDQVRRAQAFCRRVMNGTSNIIRRDYLPHPSLTTPDRSIGRFAPSSTTTSNTPCRSSSPAGATPPTRDLLP